MENHEELKIRISCYLDGETTAEEKLQVEQHLKICPDCQKYFQELQNLSSSLKRWPNEALSLDFEQKINHAAQKSKEGQKMVLIQSTVRIAAGIAVIAILVGALYYQNLIFTNQGFQIARLKGDISEKGRDMTTFLSTEDEKLASLRQEKPLNRNNRSQQATDDIGERFSLARSGSAGTTKQYEPYDLDRRNADTFSVPAATTEMNQISGLASDRLASHQQYAVTQGTAGVGDLAQKGESRRIEADRWGQPAEQAGKLQEGLQIFRGGREVEGTYFLGDTRGGEGIYWRGDREEYAHHYEEGFRNARHNPQSTFSIDVDTASYSNVRRFLNQGQLPPIDAVRIEEMINYFTYEYPEPVDGYPISVTTEISAAPWNPQHQLMLVGIQAKTLHGYEAPPVIWCF